MSKIILNGSEPDDIILNGVTPDKIMLNGQCYYEKAPEPDPHNYLYKWDFTKSLVDEKQGAEATYYGSNAASITRDSEGIHINNEKQCIYIGQMDMTGKTLEVDIPYFELAGSSSSNTDFVSHSSSKTNDYYSIRSLYFTPGSGWYCYGYGSINAYKSDRNSAIIDAQHPLSDINGKTLKIIYKTTGGIDVYFNDTLIGSDSTKWFNTYPDRHSAEFIYLGGKPQQGGGSGQTYNGNSYNMTITGVRIYENEE